MLEYVLNYTVILNSLGSERDMPSDGKYAYGFWLQARRKFCLKCFMSSRLDAKLFERIILNQHNFIL